MKCPKCLKEINDKDSFCCYCGMAINKETHQYNYIDESISDELQTTQKTSENIVERVQGENFSKKHNKHIILKILLTFLIVAIIIGVLFGVLTANGIIDLPNTISSNSVGENDFSETLDTETEEFTTSYKESDNDEQFKDNEEENSEKEKEITTNSTNNSTNLVTESTNLSSRTLIVGISPDFEPFEYYKNNELTGFDIDLIKLIANELGYDVEFKIYDFENLISAVSSGNVDLAPAIEINEERKKRVDFTDVYISETFEEDGKYIESSYAIALPKNSSLKAILNEQIVRLKENGNIKKLAQKYYID